MQRVLLGLLVLLVSMCIFTSIAYANEQSTSYFFASLHKGVYRTRRALLLEDTEVHVTDVTGNTSLVAGICSVPEDISKKVNVTISDVYFAEGQVGGALLTFLIGGNEVGTFNTSDVLIDLPSSNGTTELLPHSGQIGEPVELPFGNFSLNINIVTDEYGVSLKGIQIDTYNQNSSVDILCGGSFHIHFSNS